MKFRKAVLGWTVAISLLVVELVVAVLETVLLIIPAVITGFITNRWPKWMWYMTRKVSHMPIFQCDDPAHYYQ